MKYDLIFDPPVMNAAGTLGYAPDLRGPLNLKSLGAFITNPVSPGPRSPAQTRRYSAYAGGFLLHSGHPNPGLKAVLRKYAAQWARSPLPVLVHLLCQRIEDGVQMVQRLEGLPGVAGFELGLPSQADAASACALVRGKPSNKNPVAFLCSSNTVLIIPITTSSGTSWPLSINFLASTPNAVCRLISERNKSPVLR